MDLRVAAYGVIVREERILLARLTGPGLERWTLPGGGIDAGEHPEHAAIREIREETGYEASVGRLLGIDSLVIAAEQRVPRAEVPIQGLRIIYAASVVGGELASEVDGSTDMAVWFPLDDLPNCVELVAAGIDLWER